MYCILCTCMFLNLVVLGSSWNQPISSSCTVKSSCSSNSNIESKLEQVVDSLQQYGQSFEAGQSALINAVESLTAGQAALVDVLREISDRLQGCGSDAVTTEPPTTIEPTTQQPSHGCPGDGWRQVVFLNMTDPNQHCPSGLQLTDYSKRTCGRVSTGGNSCDSVTFPISGSYGEVCGRAKAFQFGWALSFHGFNFVRFNISGQYLDGLGFTHGLPREHIWSFTAGLYTRPSSAFPFNDNHRCPCVGGRSSPPFVGSDYFCDSVTTVDSWSENVFYADNALWDGVDSVDPCYDQPTVPWFTKQLSNVTSDDIEMRMCSINRPSTGTEFALQELEIYVR